MEKITMIVCTTLLIAAMVGCTFWMARQLSPQSYAWELQQQASMLERINQHVLCIDYRAEAAQMESLHDLRYIPAKPDGC
jgi:hypothetical protein